MPFSLVLELEPPNVPVPDRRVHCTDAPPTALAKASAARTANGCSEEPAPAVWPSPETSTNDIAGPATPVALNETLPRPAAEATRVPGPTRVPSLQLTLA